MKILPTPQISLLKFVICVTTFCGKFFFFFATFSSYILIVLLNPFNYNVVVLAICFSIEENIDLKVKNRVQMLRYSHRISPYIIGMEKQWLIAKPNFIQFFKSKDTCNLEKYIYFFKKSKYFAFSGLLKCFYNF